MAMHEKIILIAGTAGDLVSHIVKATSQSGHTVYVAIDRTAAAEGFMHKLDNYAIEFGVDIRTILLCPRDDQAPDHAVGTIRKRHGRLDVLIQATSSYPFGPIESLQTIELVTPLSEAITSAHRIANAAARTMKHQGDGLFIWVVGQGASGAILPTIGPNFVISSCLDALATQYACDLTPHGIETTIILSGLQVALAHSVEASQAFCATPQPANVIQDGMKGLRMAALPDELGRIAGSIVAAVDAPAGHRPLRIHTDRVKDGSEISYQVVDRMRTEFLYRVDLDMNIQKNIRRKEHNNAQYKY